MTEEKIDAIKRVHHFQGQFLDANDFNAAHQYHDTMRRRLNYGLYQYGIIDGLDFDETTAGTTMKITAGLALDRDDTEKQSREILLENDYEKDLVSDLGYNGGDGTNPGDTIWVTISYDDKDDDYEDVAGYSGYSRVTEQAVIKTWDDGSGLPAGIREGKDIILGKVTIKADNTLSYNRDDREIGGVGVAPVPPPVITGISPNSGQQGDTLSGVEISGTYLTGASSVSFDPPDGLTVTNLTVVADTRIQFDLEINLAATATPRNFRVTTPGGTARSENFGVNFTVNEAGAAPTISGISPNSGQQGDTLSGVEISGANLTGASSVSFDPPDGLTVTDLTVVADTRIQFDLEIDPTAPATSRNFRVTTPGGTARSEDFGLSFTVNEMSTLQSITISANQIAVPESGGNVQFTAIGHYSAGPDQDITNQVSWNSSNTSVATIDSAGLVTSGSSGTTELTAVLGGVTSNTITLVVGVPVIDRWPNDQARRRHGTETLTIFGERFAEPLQVAFPNVTPGDPDVVVSGTVISLTEAQVVVPGPFIPTSSDPAVVRSGRITVTTTAGTSAPSPQAFILETT